MSTGAVAGQMGSSDQLQPMDDSALDDSEDPARADGADPAPAKP
jgi:hypothetical protein